MCNYFCVVLFLHKTNCTIKMKKRYRNPHFIRKRFLVTQEEMASYLGVSVSLYAMAERGQRSLPSAASLKLTELEAHCIHTETAKKSGKTGKRLQKDIINQADKTARQLLKDAEFSKLKASRIEHSLEKMIKEQEDRLLWLDIIEHKLALASKKKEPVNDIKWFEYLQFTVSNKLLETDLALARLQLKIDLLKMHAVVHERHHQKISKRVSNDLAAGEK